MWGERPTLQGSGAGLWMEASALGYRVSSLLRAPTPLGSPETTQHRWVFGTPLNS